MLTNKKAIVCDLDGTLAPSKSSLTEEMSSVLSKILEKYLLIVVSGGGFSQFQKQFLSSLKVSSELLSNLYLFPTMGSTAYVYKNKENSWKQIYEEKIEESDRKRIIKAIEESMIDSGIDFSKKYGDIIEDRGTQITFSGLGQNAPINEKEVWDKDRNKRLKLVELINKKIDGFDIKIGGMTSIDITKKGIDKAYAMQKIKNIINLNNEEIVFLGDALWEGGNDEAIKRTGVDWIQVKDPNETLRVLNSFL